MGRRRELEEADTGGLEAGWPPDWMTSYADVATLLMTFFIILSTLLVLKIDVRYLRGVNVFKPAQPQENTAKSLITYTVKQKKLIEKYKNMDHQQTREQASVSQVKQMGKDIQQYILNAKLEAFVQVDTSKWKVKVTPLAPFLFSPGRATLRPAAKEFLERIAQFIKLNPGQVRIVGHTDNLPIHTPIYRSNWELSCARATTIMRYLVEKQGIKADQIIAVGYGPYHPVSSNDTDRGRALNRRVEISVFPPEQK